MRPDRKILSRAEGRERRAVGRFQVEGGDGLAFSHLADNGQRLVTSPSARLRRALSVEVLFGADHDGGQLLISRPPGCDDLRGCRLTKHGADGAKQMIANDGVVLRLHLKAGMLVSDPVHHTAKLLQMVDVGSIGKDGSCETACLSTAPLVGGVE